MNEGDFFKSRGLIKTPSNNLIAAASSGGKTSLLIKMLLHSKDVFDQEIEHIFFCYKVFQNQYEVLKNKGNITFLQRLPNVGDLENWNAKYKGQKICVLDDLSQEFLSKENLDFAEGCYSVYGHHFNITFFLLTQNLFTKNMRHLSLNSHYIFTTKYNRDMNQILTLARQIFPTKSHIFLKVYEDAIKSSEAVDHRGYVMIDCHPATKSTDMRVYTNIIPTQYPIIGYVL